MRTRILITLCVALVALAATAGTSYAHFCLNASKPVGAGTQGVFVEGTADADSYNHPKGVVPAAFNKQGNPCRGVTNFVAIQGC